MGARKATADPSISNATALAVENPGPLGTTSPLGSRNFKRTYIRTPIQYYLYFLLCKFFEPEATAAPTKNIAPTRLTAAANGDTTPANVRSAPVAPTPNDAVLATAVNN